MRLLSNKFDRTRIAGGVYLGLYTYKSPWACDASHSLHGSVRITNHKTSTNPWTKAQESHVLLAWLVFDPLDLFSCLYYSLYFPKFCSSSFLLVSFPNTAFLLIYMFSGYLDNLRSDKPIIRIFIALFGRETQRQPAATRNKHGRQQNETRMREKLAAGV